MWRAGGGGTGGGVQGLGAGRKGGMYPGGGKRAEQKQDSQGGRKWEK